MHAELAQEGALGAQGHAEGRVDPPSNGTGGRWATGSNLKTGRTRAAPPLLP